MLLSHQMLLSLERSRNDREKHLQLLMQDALATSEAIALGLPTASYLGSAFTAHPSPDAGSNTRARQLQSVIDSLTSSHLKLLTPGTAVDSNSGRSKQLTVWSAQSDDQSVSALQMFRDGYEVTSITAIVERLKKSATLCLR